ncbi:hypothetical protein DY037_05570 [Apilactobacillus micheneri]|uniref:hypothetical protein n=1 Tax=Apilactobacillus TaxID=2767877 RepID=UPI00112883EF|nr:MULTISPECIES: hypothetical protein [Apilactobacillus]TPR13018.1 hypothetical protein DY052_08440 [Apilactobacillus timberlakei]TPR49250.1 hypothetical protein DY037_05570 [Apilactobacillus micheneri]
MIEKARNNHYDADIDYKIDDVYDFVDENIRLGNHEVQYMYADLDKFLMTRDEVLQYYLQKTIDQRSHPNVEDFLNPFNYYAAYNEINVDDDRVYYDISKTISDGRLAYMPADISSLKRAKKIEQKYLSKYPSLEKIRFV